MLNLLNNNSIYLEVTIINVNYNINLNKRMVNRE